MQQMNESSLGLVCHAVGPIRYWPGANVKAIATVPNLFGYHAIANPGFLGSICCTSRALLPRHCGPGTSAGVRAAWHELPFESQSVDRLRAARWNSTRRSPEMRFCAEVDRIDAAGRAHSHSGLQS